MVKIETLRDWLPCLRGMTYLNYARTAPLLLPGAERMAQLLEESKEPLQFHKDSWFGEMEQVKKSIAQLIGASSDEIAFANSTSSALSLIAASIRWKEGDRVLYPADEYPSNRFVWDNLEGVITEALEPTESFADQLEKIDLTGVRLIACSAVSFWDGRRHELERIGKLCKRLGILFSVDAIQAVGAIPVDVKAWDCDFLACGGQKWLLGPIGTGFAYFKKERIEELRVPQIGWGSVKPLSDLLAQEYEFADGAKRFEASYFNIPAFAALGASIEAMRRIGWPQIHARVHKLSQHASKELKVHSQSGIVAFDHPKAEEIFQKLNEQRIYITQRQNRLRLSLHASVSDEELDRFFSAFRSILK